MKLSYFAIILLSATVHLAHVHSEITELDGVIRNLTNSITEIAEIPLIKFKKIIPESSVKAFEKFATEIMSNVKDIQRQLEKIFNEKYYNKLTPEEKENIKKIIGTLSMAIPSSYKEVARALRIGSNKSFDALPADLQRNILAAGLLTTDFFKKSKKLINDETFQGGENTPK